MGNRTNNRTNNCTDGRTCPYHASGGPSTIGCGGDIYTGVGATPLDPLLRALLTADASEARAVYEALSSWVENEECCDERCVDGPVVAHGRALLDRLDAAIASLVESP